MKQLVRINLTTKTAAYWTPPELTFGEDLTLALRFSKTSDGEEIDARMTVQSIKAGIGIVDRRPTGGKFALKIGPGASGPSNTTDLVEWNTPVGALKSAINAVDATDDYGAASVIFVDGSWLMFFGDQSQQVPLEVVNNGLWPLSIGRVHAWQRDGKWVHELRLTQGPLAFTTSHDIVLPPAPEITRLQAGGTDGTFVWNEIQELYVPPEFRGAYLIKKGYGKTPLLSREDDTAAIETALQALGAGGFKVSLPLSNRPNIEFIGDYAGQPMDLLVVEVKQAPAGDLTFTLSMDRAELAAVLRREGTVTRPLEVRVIGTDENGFTGELVAISLPVTIKAPVIWPEMEETPLLDLLRPYSPKTYVPFGANQTLTGNKYYSTVVGDGEAETFVVAHGLNVELAFVFVRENISGGRQLVNGTDFTVAIDNDNQVTVESLVEAPDEDGWVITVVGAQTAAQWASDLTVTVPQVVAGGGYPSLPDFMDEASQRLEDLESKYETLGVPASATAGPGMVIQLPLRAEVMFSRVSVAQTVTEKGVDESKLIGRPPYLLPAVHDGTVANLTDPLPAAAGNAGSVWQNVSGSPVQIPGGGGIRSGVAAANGYVASDGRILFPAARWAATNSYYPVPFERTLFTLAVNDNQLRVGSLLEINFGVQLQAIKATSMVQWVLSLELGTLPGQTTPDPVGENLEAVNWGTPVFDQPIKLTELLTAHFFGLRIQRSAEGFALSQLKYRGWEGNNSAAPASANFAVRARLTRFDTPNADTTARGWIFYQLVGSATTDSSGKQTLTPAQATIS